MKSERNIDITIITVCLNAGFELDKTIKSVLNQSYSSFEYIIKDGGSTDGSIERIPPDSRIKVIKNPDKGIFDAMNQALHIAQGSLINYLNAGDTYYDNQVIGSVIGEYEKDKSTDLFYGDVYNKNSRAKYIIYPKKLSKYFLFSNSICHQAWFLSRNIQLDCGGYSTTTKIGGDYLMFLEITLRKKIKLKKIESVIVEYLGSGTSTQTIHIVNSEKLRKEKRKELFTKLEYSYFSLFQWTLKIVKLLLYDKILYKVIRRYRTKKYSNWKDEYIK